MSNGQPQRVLSIAILAMGGEGGGVLADWIVDTAEHAGWLAQSTSAPGVAQRTGATLYYIELFPAAGLATGREPVFALMPVAGDVDVVIASELMEATRGVQRGLVTSDRTTLIASTNRVFSIFEKIALADGRVAASELLELCRKAAKTLVAADMAAMAERAGSVISASLLGAVAGSQALPFAAEAFRDAIRRGGIGVAPSLAAFELGLAAAVGSVTPPMADAASPAAFDPSLAAVVQRAEQEFPAAVHVVLGKALPLLADFQDLAHAEDYLARLAAIRDVDRTYGDGSWRLLTETARYLALDMAYEDVVRVAEQKLRSDRISRIRASLQPAPGDIVQVREYLRPRLQEVADLLPPALGRALLGSRWAALMGRLMTRSGKIVRTTSLLGFLTFYGMSRLRRFRRSSWRFAREQALWNEWLEAVEAIAPQDYDLACAFVECRNVVKGYGEIQELGRRNFDLIRQQAGALAGRPEAARRIDALRRAALDDDTGEAFNRLLAG